MARILGVLIMLQGAATPSTPYLLWHLTPGEGATPELASQIEAQLRVHFEKERTGMLVDSMTMDSLILVEGNEKFLRCGVGPVCLAELGDLAGVHWVIAGQVHHRGGRAVVELILVDVGAREAVSRAVVEGAKQLGPAQLEELSVAMFEPQRYHGSIEVECPVSGAEVFLDGEKVGVTPLVGPLAGIRAGNHHLEVRKPGHRPYVADIRVGMDENLPVEALLVDERFVPEPRTPFHRDWAFWTLGGSGAAFLVAAVFMHVYAAHYHDVAMDRQEQNAANWKDYEDDSDRLYTLSYVGYGVGGASLLAAGVIMVLDLTTSDDRGHSGAAVGFAPWGNGAGLSATFRF